MKLYVYAASRGRHVVVDWGACVGTNVMNLYSALFDDSSELSAAKTGREVQYLRAPGCVNGGVCRGKNEWTPHAKARGDYFPNEPPEDWLPPRARQPGPGGRRDADVWQKEWGMVAQSPAVFRYSEHFAMGLARSLKPEWKAALDAFIHAEFHAPPHHKRPGAGGRREKNAPVTVIGLHFRFGNGEVFARKPTNRTHVCLRTAAAVKKIAASLGYERYRVLVATDDSFAIDVLKEHTDLDVFAREQWRPPEGAGIVFSSWRTKDGADRAATEKAHNAVVSDASTCVRASADMLIDALLLGYADALVLPVPSTFTVLPKLMAQSRGVPYCAFIGQAWKAGAETEPAMPVRCFRRDARSGNVADWIVPVESQGKMTVLGHNFW